MQYQSFLFLSCQFLPKILIRKSPIKTLYLPILQFSADTMLWIVTQLTFYCEKIFWMIKSVEEILSWEQWAPLLCLCLILFTILGISFTFHIQIRSKLNFRYIFSKVSPAIFAFICNQLYSPNWGSQKRNVES